MFERSHIRNVNSYLDDNYWYVCKDGSVIVEVVMANKKEGAATAFFKSPFKDKDFETLINELMKYVKEVKKQSIT